MEPYQDPEWLRRHYVDGGLSTRQVASLAGCDKDTVGVWLRRHGIPIRTRSEAAIRLAVAKIGAAMRPYRNPGWLRQHYIDEGLSTAQMAKLAGCTSGTINNWLRRRGIPVRTLSEAGRASWERGDFDGEEYRQKMSAAMEAAWARGAWDGAFQSPTTIEIAVAQALDVLGYAYTSEYRPTGYSRPYDFYVFPDLLLEAQGDYFHTLPDAPERDAEKAEWARSHGFILIAFWEHDIREAVAAGTMADFVKSRIEAAITLTNERA